MNNELEVKEGKDTAANEVARGAAVQEKQRLGTGGSRRKFATVPPGLVGETPLDYRLLRCLFVQRRAT